MHSHSLLTTEWQLHGLVVPGWRVHSSTELAVTLFIVAVAVLLQSAVKAAEQAVRTTFNVKSTGRKLALRAFGALLLAADALIGYLLMLVVMSGSVWLLLTVIASSGLGYAVFWWAVVPWRPRLAQWRRRLPGRRGDGDADATDSRTAGGSGGGATAIGQAAVAAPETRPLMEPASAATTLVRDSVSVPGGGGGGGGGAVPAVNGVGKSHVLTTFSANPSSASELPACWSPAEREHLLQCPTSFQSPPAGAIVSNGSATFTDWPPAAPASSEFDYRSDGQAEARGGDLYNKYPVLTKYRKLDVDQDRSAADAAAIDFELSELDSALQELSSFQQLPA